MSFEALVLKESRRSLSDLEGWRAARPLWRWSKAQLLARSAPLRVSTRSARGSDSWTANQRLRSEERATALDFMNMLGPLKFNSLMRYSQLERGHSPDEAAAYLGGKELLRQFERSRWLKPFIRGNRLTRYDLRDLDACIDRLKAGEDLPRNTDGLVKP